MPTAPDDVGFNKAAIIERSLRRARQEFIFDPELKDASHVDAMTLNIQRACQAAIDLAMHLAARDHLGSPQSSGDAFAALFAAGRIGESTLGAMRRMSAFRNFDNFSSDSVSDPVFAR